MEGSWINKDIVCGSTSIKNHTFPSHVQLFMHHCSCNLAIHIVNYRKLESNQSEFENESVETVSISIASRKS
jgi:hypothetical protein